MIKKLWKKKLKKRFPKLKVGISGWVVKDIVVGVRGLGSITGLVKSDAASQRLASALTFLRTLLARH